MSTTDACFTRLTEELLRPGRGFWTLSQHSGAALVGTVYFRGDRHADAPMLVPHGDDGLYVAGISGRTLHAALNDAVALLDDVNAALAGAEEVAAPAPAEESAEEPLEEPLEEPVEEPVEGAPKPEVEDVPVEPVPETAVEPAEEEPADPAPAEEVVEEVVEDDPAPAEEPVEEVAP